MKRVSEMVEAELLELTSEQSLNLVDYECALEGVPMLPPVPGTAPVKPVHPFDVKVFEVGGVSVLDPEHAGRILDVLTSGPLFKTEYNSDHVKLMKEGEYGYPEIKVKMVYSPENWAAIKADMEEYEANKKAYDRGAKQYNDVVKERQTIVDTLNNAISDARDRFYTREQLRTEFARYMELAENNRRVALNFLKKVKDLSDFPELEEEFCPTTETAA